jgi:hypothetical protein
MPRAFEAVVPEEKLAGYALDPAHPRGRHKARVFSSALGIEQGDWRYLRDQLVDDVKEAPVDGMRITLFGVLYEVLDRRGRRAAAARLNLGGHPVSRCHTLR